eukprot:Blabericola_migrator_1__12666@NODE_809_length_6431_cov_77_210402_g558_i1_p1_GENE_NODE_809_length_6431_cov_77_210402_g558_i1NODE_809_length_6431_cov_77_210402_g558_i1_p1_ORF_typecomplete_len782_score96_51Sel1/PF08238_12/1_6e02Sel1/PF08238_12/1_8e04Sel1/PF08238_12/4_5e02Sel1/PF08238_12/0_033_NODE_809_length_6431_cov_77_210402_g558_i14332778
MEGSGCPRNLRRASRFFKTAILANDGQALGNLSLLVLEAAEEVKEKVQVLIDILEVVKEVTPTVHRETSKSNDDGSDDFGEVVIDPDDIADDQDLIVQNVRAGQFGVPVSAIEQLAGVQNACEMLGAAAVRSLRGRAKSGDYTLCMYNVAVACERGMVSASPRDIIRSYRAVARSPGYPPAQVAVAKYIFWVLTNKTDMFSEDEAAQLLCDGFRYCHKAAEANNPEAQAMYAAIYKEGALNVEPSPSEAEMCFRLALDHGWNGSPLDTVQDLVGHRATYIKFIRDLVAACDHESLSSDSRHIYRTPQKRHRARRSLRDHYLTNNRLLDSADDSASLLNLRSHETLSDHYFRPRGSPGFDPRHTEPARHPTDFDTILPPAVLEGRCSWDPLDHQFSDTIKTHQTAEDSTTRYLTAADVVVMSKTIHLSVPLKRKVLAFRLHQEALSLVQQAVASDFIDSIATAIGSLNNTNDSSFLGTTTVVPSIDGIDNRQPLDSQDSVWSQILSLLGRSYSLYTLVYRHEPLQLHSIITEALRHILLSLPSSVDRTSTHAVLVFLFRFLLYGSPATLNGGSRRCSDTSSISFNHALVSKCLEALNQHITLMEDVCYAKLSCVPLWTLYQLRAMLKVRILRYVDSKDLAQALRLCPHERAYEVYFTHLSLIRECSMSQERRASALLTDMCSKYLQLMIEYMNAAPPEELVTFDYFASFFTATDTSTTGTTAQLPALMAEWQKKQSAAAVNTPSITLISPWKVTPEESSLKEDDAQGPSSISSGQPPDDRGA